MRAITNSSKKNGIILDPFLGSGTTIIASEKTDRTCFGVEIDPLYVDVIVKRYLTWSDNPKVVCNGEDKTKEWLGIMY